MYQGYVIIFNHFILQVSRHSQITFLLKSRKLKIAKKIKILLWLLKRPKGQNPIPQNPPNAETGSEI